MPLDLYYDMLEFYGDPQKYLNIEEKGTKPSLTERRKKIEAFQKAQSERLKKESEKKS
jgi:hypothetical protein